MSFEIPLGHHPLFIAIFVFTICFIIFGAFFYCIWFDIRTRMWMKHFDRDTGTATAEIFSHSFDEEAGTVALSYRFTDMDGRSREGTQSVMKISMSPRYDIGNKITVYYYKKFPNHFSFIDGYKQSFTRSARYIGFFIFGALMIWWFMS